MRELYFKSSHMMSAPPSLSTTVDWFDVGEDKMRFKLRREAKRLLASFLVVGVFLQPFAVYAQTVPAASPAASSVPAPSPTPSSETEAQSLDSLKNAEPVDEEAIPPNEPETASAVVTGGDPYE